MHKYELGIIIIPTLEEEAIKAEHEWLLEQIARFGGVIDKVDNWGRRRLAYEIQKHLEGYYCFFYIDGPPEMPKEIEERLRIRESILRFMFVRREDLEKKAAASAKKAPTKEVKGPVVKEVKEPVEKEAVAKEPVVEEVKEPVAKEVKEPVVNEAAEEANEAAKEVADE